MSKYLIIPDIHLKKSWAESVIKKENADKVIFLGDYFDNFNESEKHNTQDTAGWLKDSLSYKNRIHLFGNHDIYYAYNSESSRNAGFTHLRNSIINSILSPKDWDRLKWFQFFESGGKTFLCTHAGLSKPWIFNTNAVDYLQSNDKLARQRLLQSGYHEFWHFGPFHGGKGVCGGITWCRPPEFQPIDGVNQFFGHTFQGKCDFGDFSVDGSENFCLDGAQSTYAVVVDGKTEIKYL